MAATALKEVTETIETEFEVKRDKLVRVLIIDDEEGVRDGFEQVFKEEGFDTDTAKSPDEAIELLRNNKYEVVIADIRFEDTFVTGDQLIVENKELLENSTVVAVTAYSPSSVVRRQELTDMNIKILEKPVKNAELLEIANVKLNQRKNDVADNAKKLMVSRVLRGNSDSTDNHATEFLLNELKKVLVVWFRTRQDPDKESIVYGGKVFTANELAKEVERGTKVGQEHLQGMVELLKECINLK